MTFKLVLLIALASQAAATKSQLIIPHMKINHVFDAILDFIRPEMEVSHDTDLPLEDLNLTFPIEASKLNNALLTSLKVSKKVPIMVQIHCTEGELGDLTSLLRKGDVTLFRSLPLETLPWLGIYGALTLTKFQANYSACHWTVNGTPKPKFKLELTGPKDNSFEQWITVAGPSRNLHHKRISTEKCVTRVDEAYFSKLPSMKARTFDPLLTDILNYLIEKNISKVRDLLSKKVRDAVTNVVENQANICDLIKKLLNGLSPHRHY